mmetsp:Transcript_63231/g.137522  ORF Transcript_63231/g.137522 Transcript_63231/m.137522 type:complete len:350 (-) Transcript_63231:104-1153(-)
MLSRLLWFCLGAAFLSTSSANFLQQQQQLLPGGCPTEYFSSLQSRIEQTTARNTTVRPLLVKFHKVGGTTVMDTLNSYLDQDPECSRCCGTFRCGEVKGPLLGCTGHVGRNLISDLLRRNTLTLKNQEDPSDPANLLPYSERHALLGSAEGEVEMLTRWIPKDSSGAGDKMLVLTVLRDPAERVRSLYYFDRSQNFCKLPDCLAKKVSFLEWLQYKPDGVHTLSGVPSCCEYSDFLGHNVASAKVALSTLFDVVGITENMNELLVTIARRMGKAYTSLPAAHSADSIRRDNSDNQEPWTEEERKAAEKLVEGDMEIYNFARELSERRMLHEWGSRENLDAAVEEYIRNR